MDFRKGGERLKLAANRPTRSLKAHYQACDVPAWSVCACPSSAADRTCCTRPASAWIAAISARQA
ncbi:tRNA lysidine(34) synthetase TilS [Massilia sp. Dwa41.01b]|uniref:tRNA lysidine(34) synthetase TilS n=1 Tax=Massilia sp. Dwa41.01b TaxID=2709302 RepID=UPI001E5DB51B|nr:tRNA lysidine(34) synthetase TilS [Massilia sp. Dwa41.01b]